jgi:uncharacterized protein (DUF58 family)
MGFAAYNTRNNLLYLMFSVSLAAGAVSVVAGWLSLSGLSLGKGRAQDLYAGTICREHFLLRNPSRWLEGCAVELAVVDYPGPSPKASIDHIGRGESTPFAVEKVYPRRGIYEIHELLLSTPFPFGLFRITRRVRLKRRVTVFPLVRRVDLSFVFRERLGSVPKRRKGGDSEELLRIRAYSVGDGYHHIHWKATAKLGELMVREFATNQQRSFSILFDNSRGAGEEDDGPFEALVSLAASVAAHLSAHGLAFRLVSTDEVFPYGFGLEHLRGILTYLATSARRAETKVDILSSARESLTVGDFVLVLSLDAGGEWSAIASPNLHFIEPEEPKAARKAAHVS